MAALVMAVVAGMAVGDGPAMAPSSFKTCFGLPGRWEGRWHLSENKSVAAEWNAKGLALQLVSGTFTLCRRENIRLGEDGRLYLTLDEIMIVVKRDIFVAPRRTHYFGIWEENNGKLIVCIRKAKDGWPDSLEPENGQQVIILSPVKPSK